MSKKRSKSRELVVQALYQWTISEQEGIDDIYNQFMTEQDRGIFELDYFKDLLYGVAKNTEELDNKLSPALSRPIAQIDPVERSILRLAVYEFVYHLEVPYRVIINEAIELAKIFGAEAGHKFVNGVLDKIALVERALEAKNK